MKKFKPFLLYLLIIPLLVAICMLSSYASKHWLIGTTNFGIGVFLMIQLSVLLISFLLHIFIHEIGHLIFGLISGYRFSSFRIFSVTLLRANDQWKLRRYKIPGTAGQCLMALPTGEQTPFVLYNAGGILANLIAGAFMSYFALTYHNVVEIVFPVWIFVIIGVLFVLINLLPLPNDSPNDGTNIRSMLKSDNEKRAFRSQLLINEQLTNGKSLSDMPNEWFEFPENTDWTAPLCAGMASIITDRLAESGNYDRAKEWCLPLIRNSDVPLLFRNTMQLTAILCEMAEHGWSDTCIEWFQGNFAKYVKSAKLPAQLLLLYEREKAIGGKPNRIDAYLKAFEKSCKYYPYFSEVATIRDLQHRIDKQLHK